MTIKKKTAKNATKRAKTHPLSAHDPDQHAYILRCCDKDLRSYGGFQWPEHGLVEAPDWSPTAECGQGLHGWLWGEGDVYASGSMHEDPASLWIVARVMQSEIVELGGKIKFPRAWVEFVGTSEAAVNRMCELAGAGRAIIYSTATAGYAGKATAGDRGTATAGNAGTATAGYAGTATAGDAGTATAGDLGTATAGDLGTATAGYAGTATAGYAGKATAGDRGTATAGDRGTATAGYAGTATAGYAGTATAGYEGIVAIRWWDHSSRRYRLAVGYVGEDGIKPGVAYVVCDGKLVRKDGAS